MYTYVCHHIYTGRTSSSHIPMTPYGICMHCDEGICRKCFAILSYRFAKFVTRRKSFVFGRDGPKFLQRVWEGFTETLRISFVIDRNFFLELVTSCEYAADMLRMHPVCDFDVCQKPIMPLSCLFSELEHSVGTNTSLAVNAYIGTLEYHIVNMHVPAHVTD
eukprot:jgi/Botrbrau1/12054/Bobra.0295s0009.1